MDNQRIPKAIHQPVPDRLDFLKPYRKVFKIGYHRIYQFLVTNQWDERELESIRIQQQIEQAKAIPSDVRGTGILIVDDTGFPKKGYHSVGVARQYSGNLGKVGNCQVAVSAYYNDERSHGPVTNRLYLPQQWGDDTERRAAAQVPVDVGFQTKPEIALDLVDRACEEGVPFQVVVVDAGYGGNPGFLEGLELPYVVAVPSTFGVRTSDHVFQPAYSGRGRPPKARPAHPAQTAKDVLDQLPPTY